MTKKSHNKKRNVGIIYEQLILTVSKSIINNDIKLAEAAKRIIKKYFRPGTELYKEFRLFNSLIKTHINSESLATRIIQEAKFAAKQHRTKILEREKSALIKSINYTFGRDFYKQYIKEYKKSLSPVFNIEDQL